MQFALFGAAGAVGHALSAEMDRRGLEYRAVGRDPATLSKEFPRAHAARADFLSGEGVDDAARGVETVFYLAGAPYDHFERHPIMVRNALESARRTGVKRFVHIAPVYSYGRAKSRPVKESQPHDPHTRKGRYRLEQELAVQDAHGRDGLQSVIVHLPDFYGPHADNSFANYFMRAAVAGKSAQFIGPLGAIREFVYVPDAADPLLRLAEDDGAYGRCWNLGGQPILARDFTQIAYEALGTKPKVQAVPKIALQAFGLFNPFMREVAEMYYLYDSGFVLDDSALAARIGPIAKTPYKDGVRNTLEWMKAG